MSVYYFKNGLLTELSESLEQIVKQLKNKLIMYMIQNHNIAWIDDKVEEQPKKLSNYERNKEYYRKYYQDRKDTWNLKTEKVCECGIKVKNIYHHRKSAKHQEIMKNRPLQTI